MIPLKGYKIFISSPGDLLEKYHPSVKEIIHRFNLSCIERDKVIFIPFNQEDVAGGHGNAQSMINDDSSSRDFIIVMFGKILGTPTNEYRSGTIEEYEISKKLLAENKMKDILMLFKDVSGELEEHEHEEYAKVVAYKEELTRNREGFHKKFSDNYSLSNELNNFLTRALAITKGEAIPHEVNVKASDDEEPSDI